WSVGNTTPRTSSGSYSSLASLSSSDDFEIGSSTYRIRASVLAKRAAVCVLRQNCRIFEVEGHTEGTPRDWFGKRDNPAESYRRILVTEEVRRRRVELSI